MSIHPNFISNGWDTPNNIKNRTIHSSRRLSNVFIKNNQIYPRQVFLDVRPPFEKPLTEHEFLQSLKPRTAFEHQSEVIYGNLKPLITVMRVMACLPLQVKGSGYFSFRIVSPAMFYSLVLYVLILVHVTWVLMQRIDLKQDARANGDVVMGKFEEAVIAYLFFVYLLPILMIPILWYETHKIVGVLNDWRKFEDLYKSICNKMIGIDIRQKSVLSAIFLPVLSVVMCVVIHATMIDFKYFHVIPYCLLTISTYIFGGFWYMTCEILGKAASCLADDFNSALKHIGPAIHIAEHRSLWLRLSNITRDTGIALCYSITFLSLYLFLAITLSIYGLLSQIQEGLGIKDIGLTITMLSSTGLLFYLCDEAHYASQNVRVLFQKKLLAVELTWMNRDAQNEIDMFLKATDLNPTNLSIGGFFDVNRNLFKSLLATMVTYLVVLLQFQISIPEGVAPMDNNTMITTMLPTIPTMKP